jgi:hypothetical protein
MNIFIQVRLTMKTLDTERQRGRFEAPVDAEVTLSPQEDLAVRPKLGAAPRRINCQLHSDLDLDLEFKWLKSTYVLCFDFLRRVFG